MDHANSDPYDGGPPNGDDFSSFSDADYFSAENWAFLCHSDDSRPQTLGVGRSPRSQSGSSYVVLSRDSDPSIATQSANEPRYGASDVLQHEHYDAGNAFLRGFAVQPSRIEDAFQAVEGSQIQDELVYLNLLPLATSNPSDDWVQVFSEPYLEQGAQETQNAMQPLSEQPRGASQPVTSAIGARSLIPDSLPVLGPLSRPIPPLPPKGKKRKFAPDEREGVKRTRKVGACLRCRAYGEKCNDETPCQRCTEVIEKARTFKQPCYRVSLDEVMTFRAGDSDQGVMRSEFPKLEWCRDGDIRRIELRFPFDDTTIVSPILTIECRKFHPRAKDILSEVFVVGGEAKEIVMPPYGCHDIEAAQRSMSLFMDSCSQLLRDELLASTTDELMKLTLQEAIRYSNLCEDSLVHRALKIRLGAVMNSRYLALVNKTVFVPMTVDGMGVYYFEDVPLPTMVSYVTQCLIAKQLTKEQSAIIKGMKKKIFKGNSRNKNWYEVFLTVFLMLSTVEYVYQKQKRYLGVKEGATTDSITNVKYISKQMLQEWEYSARNLIKHFRVALRGMTPFSLEWDAKSGNIERAGLDMDAAKYVKKVKDILDQRGEEMNKLRSEGARGAYDNPLVWIGELFHQGEEE